MYILVQCMFEYEVLIITLPPARLQALLSLCSVGHLLVMHYLYPGSASVYNPAL